MKLIKLPHKHIKEFDFLPLREFKKLSDGIPSLEWELYDKGSYNYKVSGIDYETAYYKMNKRIIEKFISRSFLDNLSDLFDLKINKCNNFTFHKMEAGDFSLKHTDKNNFGEIIRVIYYLSEPDSYLGGELVLYSAAGHKVYESLKMPTNSFLAFKLTDKFYHKVNKIKSGVRYCIVVTYI